jgi:SAM-dependent methyltransferase
VSVSCPIQNVPNRSTQPPADVCTTGSVEVSSIQVSETYHLDELRIALDPSHPAHILPPKVQPGSMVLDLGCGAGQTLIAAYPDQTTFGLDVDHSILKLGSKLSRDVRFCCGKAEELPYRDDTFDLVIARVSLAYTEIERSLHEASRVLKPGGRLWMTLHPWHLPLRMAQHGNWRGRLFFLYVVANSLSLHYLGKEFSLMGKRESFQTRSGMVRLLKKCGFGDICITRDKHFVIEARLEKVPVATPHRAVAFSQTH